MVSIFAIMKMDKLKWIWKDPVWSKVIAAAILFLVGIIWIGIKSYFKQISFEVSAISILTLSVPLYAIIICLVIFIIFYFYVFKNKKITGEPIINQYLNTQIGKYYFGELYKILCSKVVEIPLNYQHPKIRKDNLLIQFLKFQKYFNVGIDENPYNNLYSFLNHNLVPIILSYGLIERAIISRNNTTLYVYRTSSFGYKFISVYERISLLNIEPYNMQIQPYELEDNIKPSLPFIGGMPKFNGY